MSGSRARRTCSRRRRWSLRINERRPRMHDVLPVFICSAVWRCSENMMHAQRTANIDGTFGRKRAGKPGKVLLVGSPDVFKKTAVPRIFGEGQSISILRSTSLLDALLCLESEAIDVILVSHEFREQELWLFAIDTQRRGFDGTILRVVATPREVTAAVLAASGGSPDKLEIDRSVEAPSRDLTGPGSVERHPNLPQRGERNVLARLERNKRNLTISFTAKEQAVLMRVSEGWTNQQIARHLRCSEASIKAVLQQLFRKLGVRTRSQVVRMAFEQIYFPLP